MKKVLVFILMATVCAGLRAANVGWTNGGLSAYAGDQYAVFVIGQNGVESVAQITQLLMGASAASWGNYAFGSGHVESNGSATVAAANSGKTLAGGQTYTSFLVLFDSETLTAGTTKFVTLSGRAGQTQSPGTDATQLTFLGLNWTTTPTNGGDTLNAQSNWHIYAIPEPTSVALLALGLKRRVA